MIKCIISGYEFSDDLGKKLGKLKNIDEVYMYPLYLLEFIKNPGPLFLYDELVIDKAAADKLLEIIDKIEEGKIWIVGEYERRIPEKYLDKSKLGILRDLLHTKFVKKYNLKKFITDEDLNLIETSYSELYNDERYFQAVSYIENKYGPGYAKPDPYLFEALNVSIMWCLSNRTGFAVLDDIVRAKLYELKVLKEIKKYQIAFNVLERASTLVFGIPCTEITDVDRFLEIHRDKRIRDFRKKIEKWFEEDCSQEEIYEELKNAFIVESQGIIRSVFSITNILGVVLSIISSPSSFNPISFIISSVVLPIIYRIYQVRKYRWYDFINRYLETRLQQ